jgi:cytochrome c oxidase assembly factor 6
MGLFSSEKAEQPDMVKRSSRKVCWEARDKFFACLDKHNIEDAVKNSKEATKNCGPEEKEFEKDCIKSWVEYFKQKRANDIEKERQLKILEERGAIKLDSTTSFK